MRTVIREEGIGKLYSAMDYRLFYSLVSVIIMGTCYDQLMLMTLDALWFYYIIISIHINLIVKYSKRWNQESYLLSVKRNRLKQKINGPILIIKVHMKDFKEVNMKKKIINKYMSWRIWHLKRKLWVSFISVRKCMNWRYFRVFKGKRLGFRNILNKVRESKCDNYGHRTAILPQMSKLKKDITMQAP